MRYILLPFLALVLMGSTALTFPRLTVEHKAVYKNCHVSPNGSGMRIEFANYAVAHNELAMHRQVIFK